MVGLSGTHLMVGFFVVASGFLLVNEAANGRCMTLCSWFLEEAELPIRRFYVSSRISKLLKLSLIIFNIIRRCGVLISL